MTSVVQRINQIKQPYGGYLRPSSFKTIQFQDESCLNKTENIHPTLIGLVVDYLTRFMISKDATSAFQISLIGAKVAQTYFNQLDAELIAVHLLQNITGLDDLSIVSSAKLVTFDVWYRNPDAALYSKSYYEVNPDAATIENIKIMVNRSLAFWQSYGPITSDGFTLEGGYTSLINSGDGDYLTKDTLWDFKVSKYAPTSKYTLQILIYYLMGKHSGQTIFKDINKIGIFNPRLNIAYLKNIEEIPPSTIKEVETKVIGYWPVIKIKNTFLEIIQRTSLEKCFLISFKNMTSI